MGLGGDADREVDRRPVDRRALRAYAYVASGASSLRDVARGTANLLGLHLRYSPDGGDPMTWSTLLTRLARGGGAVLEGAYSRMPRYFQRWDRKFAASGPAKSGHAVYVERYEPRRGRVWLMDPLGQGDYRGEWISVWDLRRFAAFSRGLVRAAATPAPPPPSRSRRSGSDNPGSPATRRSARSGRSSCRSPTAAGDRRVLVPLRISTTWVQGRSGPARRTDRRPDHGHLPAADGGAPRSTRQCRDRRAGRPDGRDRPGHLGRRPLAEHQYERPDGHGPAADAAGTSSRR